MRINVTCAISTLLYCWHVLQLQQGLLYWYWGLSPNESNNLPVATYSHTLKSTLGGPFHHCHNCLLPKTIVETTIKLVNNDFNKRSSILIQTSQGKSLETLNCTFVFMGSPNWIPFLLFSSCLYATLWETLWKTKKNKKHTNKLVVIGRDYLGFFSL